MKPKSALDPDDVAFYLTAIISPFSRRPYGYKTRQVRTTYQNFTAQLDPDPDAKIEGTNLHRFMA